MKSWLMLPLLLIACLLATTTLAGDPFFRGHRGGVILGGGACVTPIQSFGSPVYSYSAPLVSNHAVYSEPVVVKKDVHHATYGDDISTALKIISEFKLKQQTLENGLNTLGYNNSSTTTTTQTYQPQQTSYGNSINYGLAPYEQGNTQYQVESFALSSYSDNVGDIKEQLNALMRLSENMQKNSVSVSSSVGSTVQTLADSAANQAESQVEVARIQSEAAARVSMIQAAAEMLRESRLNSKVDLRFDRSTEQQPTLSEPITVESSSSTTTTTREQSGVPIGGQAQVADNTGMNMDASVTLVTQHCGACHMNGKVKGNFAIALGNLSQADLDTSIAQVFSGEMPKQSKLSVAEKLQVAEALRAFSPNPE